MYCSILISNYNKEKYLKECLSSCINQDYNDFEILIGDNGSQDKSIEIINSFENIKLFNIKRKFPTAVFLLGFTMGFNETLMQSLNQCVDLVTSEKDKNIRTI